MAEVSDQVFKATGLADRVERLVISGESSFIDCWLHQRLSKFRAACPDIEFELIPSNDLDLVVRERVDLSIYWGHRPLSELSCDKLVDTAEFPVCGTQLMESDSPISKLDDLRGVTLIHEVLPVFWGQWLETVGMGEVDWRRGLVFHNARHCFQSAIQGQGVALADALLAGEDLLAGRLMKPLAETVRPAYAPYLVMKRDSREIGKCRHFREWLIDEMELYNREIEELHASTPFYRSARAESVEAAKRLTRPL